MARRGSILPGSATVTGLVVIMTVIDGKMVLAKSLGFYRGRLWVSWLSSI